MTVEDKNFNIKNGLSVGTGKHQVLDSNARITANYFTLNAGGRYLSAGVDLWDLMSTQGLPPVSTNSWNSTHLSVLSNSSNWDSVYSWVYSDSSTNNTDYNRTTFVNTSGDTIDGDLEIEGEAYLKNHLRVDGHAYLSAAMYVQNDTYVMGDFKADGDVYLATEGVYPKTVYVGATNDDNIVFVADVSSNFIPDEASTYDLGTVDQQWYNLFVQDVSASQNVWVGNDLMVSANGTVGNDFRISGHQTVSGNTTLSGTLDVKEFTTLHDDLSVKGDLYVDGNAYLSAGIDGNIYVGDTNTDNIVFNADVNSDIIPESTLTFDLGTDDKHWNTLYVHDVSASNNIRISNTLYTDTIRTDDTNFLHIAAGADDTAGSFIRLFNDNRMFLHADAFNFGDVFESTDSYRPWVLTIQTDTQHINMDSTLNVVDDATFNSDVWIKGDLRVDGNAWLSAGVNGVVYVGDTNTDNVVFRADVDSSIIPDDDVTYDLGTSTQQWRELFVQDISATNDIYVDNDLLVSANGTIGTDFRVSGHTTVGGNTVLSGTLDVQDFVTFYDDLSVKGDLYVDGNAYLSAGTDGNIYVGDTDGDNVVFRADINSDLIPEQHHTFDIGTDDKHWNTLFVNDISANGDVKINQTLFVDQIRPDLETRNTVDINAGTINLQSGDSITDGSGMAISSDRIRFNSDRFTFGDIRETADGWRPWVLDMDVDAQTAILSATLTGKLDATFEQNLTVLGDTTLGNSNTDNVVFAADVDSNITPNADVTYDLGTNTKQWRELFVQDISASGDIFVDNNLSVSGDVTVDGSTLLDGKVDVQDDLTVTGHVSAVSGMTLTGDLTADDDVYIKGNIIVNGHAYFGFDSNSTNISLGNDGIDEIIFEADVGSDILPYPSVTYNLGSSTRRWLTLYTHSVDATGSLSARGDIVTREAIIKTKVPSINQKIQTREDIWRGYNGGATTEIVQIETFNSDEFQSAEYNVMLIRHDESITTVKVMVVSTGTDVNATVYGNCNIGLTEPLVGINAIISNNKIVLNVSALSWTKIMISGKAMHLT